MDRLEYNAAMASPAAPGSLLVGLHGGDSVYLGVQKDQIVRIGKDKCKVRNGKHDEILPIVRENDHLVVVEAKRGVMFTGDFPHAGVRNFSADSDEQRLMDMLKEKIAEIADRYPVHERVLRTKATVEMMANFPGLNKLCRLHCSTRMVKGGILVPDNSVGFDGCLPNEPDRRCFENDVVEEVEETVEVKAPPKRRKLSESPKQRIVSGSSSSRPKIVTPEREDEPRSYEGWRVAKFYRGKVNFGTVHEHAANGVSALLRFDDGDFEMCRLSEVKNLIRLYSENEQYDEQAIDICDKRSGVRQARPADGEAIWIAADTSGHLFWKSVSKEDVLVRTKVAGKLICSGIATSPGKATGKRNSIFKVAKERDGESYKGTRNWLVDVGRHNSLFFISYRFFSFLPHVQAFDMMVVWLSLTQSKNDGRFIFLGVPSIGSFLTSRKDLRFIAVGFMAELRAESLGSGDAPSSHATGTLKDQRGTTCARRITVNMVESRRNRYYLSRSRSTVCPVPGW